MGTLSNAFSSQPQSQKASILGQIFSCPLVRGSYKDEKPEIDMCIEGGSYEKKRLISMINMIARNSPTGRKVLQDAADAGYKLCFSYQANCYGSCNDEDKVLTLNPSFKDSKLTTTLAHEARHAQQHLRGVPSRFCQKDVATELKLRRATEADAQATAAQTALEIRAATKDPTIWKEFSNVSPRIALQITEPPLDAPVQAVFDKHPENMKNAFKGWFKDEYMIDSYEYSYLTSHMDQVYSMSKTRQRDLFKSEPFSGHMSSAEIVNMVCTTASGKSYFADDPDIMDRTPEMCGILKETKASAKEYFDYRTSLTGQNQDHSFERLPVRRQSSSLSFSLSISGDIKQSKQVPSVVLKTLMNRKQR